LARYYPENLISQIAASTDIVQLIGEKVRLSRKGRQFWGLCPFHDEKTPSFAVHPERQFYHCFGCGESGDSFRFIMKTQRAEFPEAVRILATRTGISLPETEISKESRDKTARLRKLLELARDFYCGLLRDKDVGITGYNYLRGRNLGDDSIRRFHLGYSLESWDALLRHAGAAGFHSMALEEAGLAIRNREGTGHYDRFRNRVMFPIKDVHGSVVGFGARTMGDDQPKYLNSPETTFFSKRRNLYGLSEGLESIRAKGQAIIMEGYTDVIMAHQMGIDWAVATLGTALTQDHIRVLRRYVDSAILVFDSDEAGIHASERSAEVFLREDFPVKVCVLTGDMDPCDFLCERGPEEFLRQINTAEEILDFQVRQTCKRFDMTTLAGRMSAFDQMSELLLSQEDTLRQQELLRLLCEKMGVDQRAASQRLAKRQTRRIGGAATNEASETGGEELTGRDLAETELIGLLLTHNELISEASEIFPDRFHSSVKRDIARRMVEIYEGRGAVTSADLSNFWVDQDASRILAAALERECRNTSSPRKRLEEYFGYWRYEKAQQETRGAKMLLTTPNPRTEDEEARLIRLYHQRQQSNQSAAKRFGGSRRGSARFAEKPREDEEQ